MGIDWRTAAAAAADLAAWAGRRLFELGWLLMFWGIAGLAVLVPYLAARPLLQWSQSSLPRGVHAFVLVILFLMLGGWAFAISGDRGSALLQKLYSQGIRWTFLFSISLLLFATLCFASLSSTLSDWGVVRFEPAAPHGEFWRLQDFYMWHFLDSIPGLEVPETFLWNKPFQYQDHLTGLLLLLYKVLVILPVIGSFAAWNRIRKDARKKDGPGARMKDTCEIV